MKNLIITDQNSYFNIKHKILYINKYCKDFKDFSILNFIEENSDEIKISFKKDLKKNFAIIFKTTNNFLIKKF